MKRRSFIATLAAGIAGLFVPLPKAKTVHVVFDKSETVFRLVGDICWTEYDHTGIVHRNLEFYEVSLVDMGPNHWGGINRDHDSRYHFATTGELKT